MAGAAAVVHGIGVVVAEIVAGHAVQVFVIDVHAAVDDGDDHARIAVGDVPRRLGVGVEAHRAHGRTGVVVGGPVVADHLGRVVVAPVVGVEGIVGHGRGEGQPFGLRRLHRGIGGQPRGQGGHVARGDRQHEPAVHARGGGLVGVRRADEGPRDAGDAGRGGHRVHARQPEAGAGQFGAQGEGHRGHGLGVVRAQLHQHVVGNVGQDGGGLVGESVLDGSEGPGQFGGACRGGRQNEDRRDGENAARCHVATPFRLRVSSQREVSPLLNPGPRFR